MRGENGLVWIRRENEKKENEKKGNKEKNIFVWTKKK